MSGENYPFNNMENFPSTPISELEKELELIGQETPSTPTNDGNRDDFLQFPDNRIQKGESKDFLDKFEQEKNDELLARKMQMEEFGGDVSRESNFFNKESLPGHSKILNPRLSFSNYDSKREMEELNQEVLAFSGLKPDYLLEFVKSKPIRKSNFEEKILSKRMRKENEKKGKKKVRKSLTNVSLDYNYIFRKKKERKGRMVIERRWREIVFAHKLCNFCNKFYLTSAFNKNLKQIIQLDNFNKNLKLGISNDNKIWEKPVYKLLKKCKYYPSVIINDFSKFESRINHNDDEIVSPSENNTKLIEICFMMDMTGTEKEFVEGIKMKMEGIIAALLNERRGNIYKRIRISFVLIGEYATHPMFFLFQKFDFSNDPINIQSFIRSWQPLGERFSNYLPYGLGFAETSRLSWSSQNIADRYVVVVGDNESFPYDNVFKNEKNLFEISINNNNNNIINVFNRDDFANVKDPLNIDWKNFILNKSLKVTTDDFPQGSPNLGTCKLYTLQVAKKKRDFNNIFYNNNNYNNFNNNNNNTRLDNSFFYNLFSNQSFKIDNNDISSMTPICQLFINFCYNGLLDNDQYNQLLKAFADLKL